jgi:hypothetical protein
MRLGTYASAPGDSGGSVVTGTFPDVGLLGIHYGICPVWVDGVKRWFPMYSYHTNVKNQLDLDGWYMG